MRALDLKLWRDLGRLKGQGLTIALVVACGIAAQVAAVSTYRSLVQSKRAFYDSLLFADLFAQVQNAPESVVQRLEQLPGVSAAEGRVVKEERVEVPGWSEPVRARFVGLPGEPRLNRLFLRTGRRPERDDEVVVSELFARAHALVPGSELSALLEGRRTRLRVVGTGVSPEYVWILPQGSIFSDDRRYGVLWMTDRPLSSAVRMQGHVNDLSLRLAPGGSGEAVRSEVDRILAPYGSYGAYGRDKQGSNRLVEQELRQLKGISTVPPLIFLGVAAFLLNVLLSRVVLTQREQIATLRAVGYPAWRLALHYTQLALVIVLAGAVLGVGFGSWAGSGFVRLYTRYFRFAALEYRLDVATAVRAVALSAAAGLLGALLAVQRVVRLAPAEAMRPEAPPSYRASAWERVGLGRLFSVVTRMLLRDLSRQPWRTATSAAGIAFATAILVVGNMGFDTVDRIFHVQFELAQREDVTVSFTRPLPERVGLELARIPGVLRVETRWSLPARVWARGRSRDVVLSALPGADPLQRPVDQDGAPVPIPPAGFLMSRILAERLGSGVGDTVHVESLEGKRRARDIRLTSLVDDTVGVAAYTGADVLERLTGEAPSASEAALSIDRGALDRVLLDLARLPNVASVRRRAATRDSFRKQVAESFLTMQLLLAVFAGVIAVGVVYNNARIALAVRGRDLATLRILGFRRSEVGRMLLVEQLVQLLIGIPLGIPLGKEFARLAFQQTDPELFRLPVVMSGRTAATAAVLVILAGSVSALFVQARARRMDLVSVLKARD